MAVLVLAGLAVAGCDLPTGLPLLETEWIVPGPATVVPAAAFLPSGITLSDDGSSASVTLARADSVVTLGQICQSCSDFDGLRVLKPAFQASVDVPAPLPDSVLGGEMASGEVEVELRHTMGFDPIRPGLGNTGVVRVQVLSGTTVTGEVLLDGGQEAFPPGQAVRRTVDLTAAAPLNGGHLTVRALLDSPLGSATLINENATLSVVALGGGLELGRITVSVEDRIAPMTPTLFQVGGIGPVAAKRITRGVLRIDLSNPFGRPLQLALRIEAGGSEPIERSVAVSAEASSSTSVELTSEELLTFLGLSSVRLRGQARVVDADPFPLRPTDVLGLASEWTFHVRTGGS